MYSSEPASQHKNRQYFFSFSFFARPVDLNIPLEKPQWQSCLFHNTHRSLWAQLNSLCGNRVEGSCKLAGEAKTRKRKEKQSAPQPGGRDLLSRLQSRLAWQTPLRPLLACSFYWQSRKGEWEKEAFAAWHSDQPCQIGLTSPCDLLHQRSLVMALQGYRCTHEPGACHIRTHGSLENKIWCFAGATSNCASASGFVEYSTWH